VSRPVTRQEIAEEIRRELGIPIYLARKMVNFLVDELILRLNKGEKIKISGFGTFEVKHQKGRKGRNLKNGEIVEIPPHERIVFHPSKKLKRLLNPPFR